MLVNTHIEQGAAPKLDFFKNPLRMILRRFALPLWPWYAGGVIFLLGSAWITISIPRFSKIVVNDLLSQHPHDSIFHFITLIISLGILQMIVRSLSRLLFFWPGRKIESEIKTYYFDHLLEMPLRFFQKHTYGDLVSRLANDVAQIRACMAFGTLQIGNLIFLSSFSIFNMYKISPNMTIACLSPLLCMIIVARLAAPMFHKYSKRGQLMIGELTNRVTEAFIHVDIVQANDAIDSFIKRISQGVNDVYDNNIKIALVRTVMFPIASLFTGLAYLVVLFYGGQAVIQQTLTIGDILAFNIYIALLSFPLTALGIIISLIQRARSACERLIDLEKQEKEKSLRPKISTTNTYDPAKTPILSVQNLTFRYQEGSPPVLQNLSFDLAPSYKLGISGPIGSGKTTLLSLIARLYDPEAGSILYKGEDILSFNPSTLRHEIGFGLQTPYLFSSSITENLVMGFNQKPNQEHLVDCARRGQILSEIENLERKWDTPIGEKGVRLSGGQRQRLAITRLFLRQPDLILLDDVTAAVDQSTEKKLLDELAKLPSAYLIVSHRPAALKICDQVILLNNHGQIVDRAPYQDLLTRYPLMFVEIGNGSK